MRKKNQEIKDKVIIEEILSKSVVCRIAFWDKDVPYILPFNFGYENNCIYIHCAPEGKKIDLLNANNKVSFEIEEMAEIVKDEKPCKWATVYRSVIGQGEIEMISDFNKKTEALGIIMNQYGTGKPTAFEVKQVNSVLILKLQIRTITGKQSGNWDKMQSGQLYETESERLHIREVDMEDLRNIHKLHSCPEVDEFNTMGIPENLEETRNYLKTAIAGQTQRPRKSYTWKLIRKDTREFIGIAGISLSRDRFKLGEIHYSLLPGHWGNGYAVEVAKRLIKVGFEDFNLHKIEAGVATENSRSVRVLEKAGMTREGLRRKILPIRGEWKDNYHYAILGEDLRQKQPEGI